jgi:hypothetical protein
MWKWYMVNDDSTWDSNVPPPLKNSQDPKGNYFTEQSRRDSIVEKLDQIQLYNAKLCNF